MDVAFQNECLAKHNAFRAKHGVCELKLNISLQHSAQSWAEELVTKNNLINSSLSSRGEVGENISARTNSNNKVVDIAGTEIAEHWYSDAKTYKYNSPEGDAGNFSQMIWRDTREVGFGKASKEGRCVVVAQYKPPGNVRGQYIENVRPPIKDTCTSVKTTVVTEKVIPPKGESYVIRKEITTIVEEDGTIRKRIKETRIESKFNEDSTNSSSDSDVDTSPENKEADSFIKDVITAHNCYRQCHGAKALKGNKKLHALAQKWAEHLIGESGLSNSCSIYKNERVGENIASRWSNGLCDYLGQEVCDHWYSEESNYNYTEEPTHAQGIGNFTQMVWRNSKEIGVGKARITQEDGSTRVIVVCHYVPAGNVLHCFKENVSPLKQ